MLNSKHIRFKSNASRCVCADVPVRSRNTVGSNFLIPVGLARTNSQNNAKSTDAVLLGCFWNIGDCCYTNINIFRQKLKNIEHSNLHGFECT